jgi:hypothetical protein
MEHALYLLEFLFLIIVLAGIITVVKTVLTGRD